MAESKATSTSLSRPEDPIGDFHLWTALGQDYEQTAAALRCTREEVAERAVRNAWERRVGSLKGSPVEQRQINRALVFVTAARLRSIVDDEIARIAADKEHFVEVTTEYTPKGAAVRSFKNLKLLAEALSECNAMTRGALGDSVDTCRDDEARICAAAGAAVSVDVRRALDAFDKNPKANAMAVLGALGPAETAHADAAPAEPPRAEPTGE